MEYVCVLVAHLSNLLYFGPSLANERATLAGGDDQPQGDWRLGTDGAVGHQRSQVLQGDRYRRRKMRKVSEKERGARGAEKPDWRSQAGETTER